MVIVWLFYYYLFVPDFIDIYSDYVLKHCEPDEVEAKTAQLTDFKKLYENPLFVVLITYSEVLPVGLIVSLISALMLKKQPKSCPAG